MQTMETQFQNKVVNIMKRIEEKINFIEDEIVTIKSWISDDGKLSPYEKKQVDETIKKVKAGKFIDLPTLEDLKEKIGA